MSDPVELDATLSGDSPVMNETSNVMPTNPTVEMVKEWDNDQLLKWIQQKRPKLLQVLAEEIAGGVKQGKLLSFIPSSKH